MTHEGSAAFHLEGVELEDGWRVLTRVELPDDHTGGAFSVQYLVEHPSGSMGFLKAFDYSAALDEDDPPRALADLTATFNAERDLLEQCGKRKLRRIVRALGAGTVRVEGFSPAAVSYLIFELADGDARDVFEEIDVTEQIPMLRLAHHAAVGMSQLHSLRIAHQDVKPSNLLVWKLPDGHSGKLGDLGCAHVEGRVAPHDDQPVPGDCAYAAPEQLYDGPHMLTDGDRRFAADLYMLGNLLCFLLTGITYSALLYGHLDDSQHWRCYTGNLERVLPGLIDGHGQSLRRVRDALRSALADEVVNLLDELCYPDPRLRGDPTARRFGQSPYRLERYVSRLDCLHRKASIAARRSA